MTEPPIPREPTAADRRLTDPWSQEAIETGLAFPDRTNELVNAQIFAVAAFLCLGAAVQGTFWPSHWYTGLVSHGETLATRILLPALWAMGAGCTYGAVVCTRRALYRRWGRGGRR